jgi:hypothetical protein
LGRGYSSQEKRQTTITTTITTLRTDFKIKARRGFHGLIARVRELGREVQLSLSKGDDVRGKC